ncbi:MAG: hypothetical protein ACXWZ2_12080 [Mycobacterium sp.]
MSLSTCPGFGDAAGWSGRPPDGESFGQVVLTATAVGPSALLIEGEPGIGKFTLWFAAAERATASGFRVLSTRAAAAESVLGVYRPGGLLDDVDCSIYPEPTGLTEWWR